MKLKHLITVALIAGALVKGNCAHAQGMAVNATGAAANSSAMLDVSSTTQGVLVPRMTTAQRTAISTPATGLLVYQTDGTAGFYFYNGTAWTSLSSSGGSGTVTSVSSADLSPVFTSSVANATTTPSLSYSLSTATAHTFLGNSTGSSATPTYSKVGVNDLSATGTASATNFLRGDGTWAAPSGGGSNVAYTYTSQSSSTTAVAGTAYIAATDGITFTLPSSPATGATIRIVVPHTFTSVGINFGSKGGFGAVSFSVFAASATKIVGTDLEYAQTFVYDGSTWLQTPQF